MKSGIHGDVVLRSDQDPAVTSLLDEVCLARAGTRIVAEKSPFYRRVHKLAPHAGVGEETGETVAYEAPFFRGWWN